MLKSSKGITLVALVITIIVLLILAGVTLSIVWNNGIIDKSQKAVENYQDASNNETLQMNFTQNMMEKFWYNATATKS